MRKMVGRWLAEVSRKLLVTDSHKLVPSIAMELTAAEAVRRRAILATGSMSFEEAQDIVMHFSNQLHLNGEEANRQSDELRASHRKIGLAESRGRMPFKRTGVVWKRGGEPVEGVEGLFYSRKALPYTKDEAVRAFKVYYVLVKDPAAASQAWYTLGTRVTYILPDDTEEPTLVDDLEAHIEIQRIECARLDEELPTLLSIRSLNEGRAAS